MKCQVLSSLWNGLGTNIWITLPPSWWYRIQDQMNLNPNWTPLAKGDGQGESEYKNSRPRPQTKLFLTRLENGAGTPLSPFGYRLIKWPFELYTIKHPEQSSVPRNNFRESPTTAYIYIYIAVETSTQSKDEWSCLRQNDKRIREKREFLFLWVDSERVLCACFDPPKSYIMKTLWKIKFNPVQWYYY